MHIKKFDFCGSLYESQHLDDRIHYLEFGVATGDSLTWWIDHIKHI
jgi:O-methyltransferase